MDLYEFISLIVLPLSILHFSLDYLSDKNITKNEIKIGFLQFLHHFIAVSHAAGFMMLPFFKAKLSTIVYAILVSLSAQTGWLANNNSCWLLKYINCIINQDQPNRKWRGDLFSLVKHYTRGDDWAYSDIRNTENFQSILTMNGMHIFTLIKYFVYL